MLSFGGDGVKGGIGGSSNAGVGGFRRGVREGNVGKGGGGSEERVGISGGGSEERVGFSGGGCEERVGISGAMRVVNNMNRANMVAIFGFWSWR